MIVCDNPRFVFIHTPRTGGIAFYDAVRRRLPQARVIEGPTGYDTHMPARAAREQYPDHPQITVMRSPWQIVASLYRMFRAWCDKGIAPCVNDEEKSWIYALGGQDFGGFVRQAVAESRPIPNGGFSVEFTEPGTRVFQYHDRPYERIAAVLGIRLGMLRLNGFLPDLPIPWTPALIELVGRQCRWDVERFGYLPPMCP